MKRIATKTCYFQNNKYQLVGCSSGTYMYKATRFMYAHKDHAYLHKVIVTVSCFNGKHLPLIYVQYFFEGAEHEHTSNQLFHGNNLKKSDRSSRPEMFCRKGGLKNFTKFTGKHPCRSLLFNKIADLSLFFTQHLWRLLR